MTTRLSRHTLRRSLAVAAIGAVALLGAACTDDDPPDADATTPTTTAPPTEGTPAATPTEIAPTSTAPPSTATATPTEAATETATATAAPEGGCDGLAPEAEEASFVFVSNVSSGDSLASGATISGCSRTFESNVTWQIEDREGNVVAEGFTMGGGVDGHAEFEFVVEYEVAEPQVGHLIVEAPDPSDGEGFPAVVNRIPVILGGS
ncbi:MAG: Gmad2 immunoglobulin-like domain-containing protein [Dehalococcoidia bacterium]